jgi:hypothetical protein
MYCQKPANMSSTNNALSSWGPKFWGGTCMHKYTRKYTRPVRPTNTQRQQTPELQRPKQHQPKSKSKQATNQSPSQSKQPTNVQIKASNQPTSKSKQATNQRPSQSKQPTKVQVKASNQPTSKSKQATNQSPSITCKELAKVKGFQDIAAKRHHVVV